MKKGLIAAIIVALIAAVGLGAWWVADQNNVAEVATTNSSQTTENSETLDTTEEKVESVQYEGQDGKNALELLRAVAEVETSGSGDMVFVSSINGVAADPSTEFWEFRVNGEMASVGAAQYDTKNGETITWTLTKIEPNYSDGSAE